MHPVTDHLRKRTQCSFKGRCSLFPYFNTSTLIFKDLGKKNTTRSLGGEVLGSWNSECEYILSDLTSKILTIGEESGTYLATWDAQLLFPKVKMNYWSKWWNEKWYDAKWDSYKYKWQ